MSNHATNYLALEAFAAANARSMGARSRFQFGDLMVYARIAARRIGGKAAGRLTWLIWKSRMKASEGRGNSHIS